MPVFKVCVNDAFVNAVPNDDTLMRRVVALL